MIERGTGMGKERWKRGVDREEEYGMEFTAEFTLIPGRRSFTIFGEGKEEERANARHVAIWISFCIC